MSTNAGIVVNNNNNFQEQNSNFFLQNYQIQKPSEGWLRNVIQYAYDSSSAFSTFGHSL